MPTTPYGKADASVSAEAGRLVADAVKDTIADALLSITSGDAVASKGEPEPPAPSQARRRPAGGPDRAPTADTAVARAESAVAATADTAVARVESAVAAAVSAVLSRVDVNAVLDHVDVNAVLDQVDLQRVLDRVDVNAVVQRVDLNDALAEVDVNALIQRVDVDAIVDRVDVGALTAEALDSVDIGEVIRESTASLGSDTVEGFRQQAMIADGMIATMVDRLLRRSGPRATALDSMDDRS